MLAEKMEKTGAACWLINTGWTGGAFGKGKRFPLKVTRAIIDAIHDGSLAQAEYTQFPVFNLSIPKACPNVPAEMLNPYNSWSSKDECDAQVKKLAGMFTKAFSKYEKDCDPSVAAAGPQL